MRWASCSCANRRSRSSFTLRTKRDLRSHGLTALSRGSAESNGERVTPEFQSLDSGMAFRAIELPGSVAFQFRDDASGRTALFAPSAGGFTPQLRDALHTSDLVMFDGTFWSDGELGRVRPGARSAREMNHLPIDGGSFDVLRQSPARRKIYIHINNTNPILMPGSHERAQVEDAGIEIARDGLEIVL